MIIARIHFVLQFRVGFYGDSIVIVTYLAANLLAGRTKLDIMLTPMLGIVVGGLFGIYAAPFVTQFTSWVGYLILVATTLQPFVMGIIISVVFCFILMSPLSSSALAIGLGLSGIAAGAAVVGTATSMVGFAVISFKDNGLGGLVAQGLGTSKIQFANFVKNPFIFVPQVVGSAVVGPLATVVFGMETNSLGAGMGTSGLVGQIQTLYVMGTGSILLIVLLQIAVPAIVCYGSYRVLHKAGYIKDGDMKLTL